jgi:hypothetical protein
VPSREYARPIADGLSVVRSFRTRRVAIVPLGPPPLVRANPTPTSWRPNLIGEYSATSCLGFRRGRRFVTGLTIREICLTHIIRPFQCVS